MSDFPCNRCQAQCCGPVPLSAERLDRIEQYLAGLPAERIHELKEQRRPNLTCQFVDMRDWSCVIHPVRPVVCGLYGRMEKMICPKVGRVVNPELPIMADMLIAREYRSDHEMMSTEYVYRV